MRPVLEDRAFRRAVMIAVVVAVPTMLVLGPDSFLLMLARSFLRQWVLAFGVLAVFFAIRRRTLPAMLAGAATLLLAAQIPWPSTIVDGARTGDHLLRVGQFNVLQPNKSKLSIIEAARASDADVLSFQEVDAAWAAALEQALSQEFPYRCIVPRSDCYGIAFFSRSPLDTIEVIDLFGAPAVRATVRRQNGVVSVTAVHARSPFPYGAFVQRNEQLELLARVLRNSPFPQVVIGDLNAVSWDDALVGFRERAGLNAAPVYEQATFPSVLGMALIPIDHILGSSELTIGNVSTAHLRGSDHRALVADIWLRMP